MSKWSSTTRQSRAQTRAGDETIASLTSEDALLQQSFFRYCRSRHVPQRLLAPFPQLEHSDRVQICTFHSDLLAILHMSWIKRWAKSDLRRCAYGDPDELILEVGIRPENVALKVCGYVRGDLACIRGAVRIIPRLVIKLERCAGGVGYSSDAGQDDCIEGG